MEPVHRLLVLGAQGGTADAIGARLIAHGRYMCVDADADAVLIDGMDVAADTPFLDLGDDMFAAQAIDATVDRVALLQDAVTRAAPGASIVVIGSDAHLGRWHGTGQAAASAALLGVMRSVAMEYARHGLRANMIALPTGTTGTDATLIADAARQADALFETGSITGETILIDGGENLKFRQAKRR